MRHFILIVLAALMVTGCTMRVGSKSDKLINDGHDYQWIAVYDRLYLIHSPECDSCKAIRKQEMIELIDSLIKSNYRRVVLNNPSSAPKQKEEK